MKTIRVILVFAAISLACTLHAQKRVAVLIVGDYTGSGVPVQNQWNDGNMGGGTQWDEFWNDTYLLWEYLLSNQNDGGVGYFNDYVYIYFANGNNFVSQNPNYIVPQNTVFTDAAATIGNVEDLFDGLATGTSGFPQLTSEDFLFIWTMGHGGSSGNNSYMYLMDGIMSDTEFGGLVNNVTAQKKVIWMQQGFAGGFADNFTDNNVIFYSACGANENAHRANNTPYLENELWNNVPYYHGEFDFHTYSPLAGLSPGGDDEYNGVAYSSADANSDNIISVSEIHNWQTTYLNTSETSVLSDPGNIASTTSIKYPNIISSDINTSQTMSGYIGITKPVHVLSGVTLTFSNADVNLDYDGQLIVDAGGRLILDDNESITAWATYGQRKIIINGYLEIGDNLYTVTLNALADESRLKIIINNKSLNLTFNHSDLRFTILETHNNSNSFNNCGLREFDLLA